MGEDQEILFRARTYYKFMGVTNLRSNDPLIYADTKM